MKKVGIRNITAVLINWPFHACFYITKLVLPISLVFMNKLYFGYVIFSWRGFTNLNITFEEII